MRQIIVPNPNIRCEPGWCLQYVRQTFGLPARYGSATEAWANSASQHRDRNFPAGLWVPVWYGLAKEPAGHVVLMAPDGSVYSTSDYSNTPHHHPDLADLEAYYARYGMDLTYRGWTEDVAGYPVLGADGGITVTVQSTTTNNPTAPQQDTTTEEDFMGGMIDAQQAEDIAQRAADLVFARLDNNVRINAVQAESIVQATTARTTDAVDARSNGKVINAQQADDIAQAAARYNQEQDANLYKNRESN